MRASSAVAIPSARQDLPPNIIPDFGASVDSIRVLLRSHLPHGTKGKIAEQTKHGIDQVSRQLNGVEGLQAGVIMAAFQFVPETVRAAVLTIFAGGTPEYEKQEALIIRMRDGQLFLPGILS